MANAVARLPLSGSVQYKGIKVVATATPGTLIHTTGISATVQDELWLYCQNSDTAARKLTLEFGGVATPDNLIEVTVPAESGLLLIVPGLILAGDAAVGLTVGAFAATTNVLMVYGYILRLVP